MSLLVNGEEAHHSTAGAESSGHDGRRTSGSRLVQLAAGDTVQLRGAGGRISVGDPNTGFSGFRIY